MNGKANGKVFLVGAGPGDPELLTVKAHRLLQKAEVVVYDRLVNKALLELVPEHCEKIYAGKRKHLHTLSQQQINEVLITHASAGKCVVRLKGGDPYIFGRGGEELDALIKQQIPCEVVPGITAAQGAAAGCGLPLTHRQTNQAITYITAHRTDGVLDINWPLVTQTGQAVVFYMGLSVLHELVQGLQQRGVPGDCPFSIVSQASLPCEQTIHGTLDTILDISAATPLKAPALLIMGIPHRQGIKNTLSHVQLLTTA